MKLFRHICWIGYNRSRALGGDETVSGIRFYSPGMPVKVARTLTLLLVEDSPGDVRLTREALRDSPVPLRLEVVSNGEDALNFLYRRGQFANSPRPDLILLDMNLPRVSGRQVLETIKQDPELLVIPVLVMTTSRNPQDILAAYRLQANSFIQKPVDLGQFLDVMKAIENFWLRLAVFPTLAAEADAR